MVRLSNIPSAPLLSIALLLLSRLVCSIPQPQFITSSDAEYQTDVNGAVIATIAGSLSVAVDANGLPLSTAFVTSTAVAVPAAAPAVTANVPVVVTNPLGPAPVTTYAYTTIDADGNAAVVTATFTPTYQPTVYPTSYRAATILAYSDFTSLYNIASATADVAGAGTRRAAFEGFTPLLWSGAATFAALVGGARLVAML